MWDKAEFEKASAEVHRLSEETWKDGHGHVHHADATTVVLDHKSGNRLWCSLIHLPSDVQDGCELADNQRSVVWRQAVTGWGKYHKNHKNDWHCDQTMYVADWNVDFRKQCWREYVNNQYPNCKGTWRKDHLPADGTHGDRLIDATWTDGKFNKALLLPDDKSSDHRPDGERHGEGTDGCPRRHRDVRRLLPGRAGPGLLQRQGVSGIQRAVGDVGQQLVSADRGRGVRAAGGRRHPVLAGSRVRHRRVGILAGQQP
jgi:hypothetical protein